MIKAATRMTEAVSAKVQGLVPDPKTPPNKTILQQNMADTYHNLRIGLAFVSVVFPLWMMISGALWYGIPVQDSLSAYYWIGSAEPGYIRSLFTQLDLGPDLLLFLAQLDGDAPMRSMFVGMLFTLGIFFYLYKGFSWQENYLLNAAGFCTIMVALFPMEWNCITTESNKCDSFSFHGMFAIVAFVCIALVALRCSTQTLSMEPRLNEQREKRYHNWYKLTGLLMTIFPVISWGVTMLPGNKTKLTLFLELLGIWAFVAFWVIKSRELKERPGIPATETETEAPPEPAGQLDPKPAPALAG